MQWKREKDRKWGKINRDKIKYWNNGMNIEWKF